MNLQRSLFLAFAILATFTACDNGDGPTKIQTERMQVMMSKPWRYDAEAIFSMVDFTKLTPQQQTIISTTANSMSKSYISFLPDSVMTAHLASGDRLRGWWAVSSDGKEILIQPTPRRVKPLEVVSFSPERIILNNDPEEG
ncbi:MAG: hypothetical protein KDC54_10065, partial [Lewinella sp.]|nr:hypothetical protein [Lewinella sp.]